MYKTPFFFDGGRMINGIFYTVMEMKTYLNIGRSKAYTLCKSPDFPTIRLGNKILVDKRKLDEWIMKRENNAND